MSTDKATKAAGANECPVCGETADWLEEEWNRIEYGCLNHHTWHVEK